MARKRFKFAKTLPPGMLRRNPRGKDGKPGTYKLRFCYRPMRHMSAVTMEIGLRTRHYETAHLRAVFILRAFAKSGQLTGLYAENLDLSIRKKISPSKKACTPAVNGLKQGMLSFG